MISAIKKILEQDSALKYFFYFSIACVVTAIIGLVADPRILVGVPIWLKPFKFAVSTILFSFTILWFLQYLKKTKGIVNTGRAISFLLFVELVIIFLQSYRGRESHFNNYSVEDAILFSIMGGFISIVWLLMIVYIRAFFCVNDLEKGLLWSIRLGLIITFLSMPLGFLMTKPTAAQIKIIEQTKTPIGNKIGGHAVGVPDGGPGLPLTGWSVKGGDLRIAHFAGTHALQILPLLAYLLTLLGIRKENVRRNLIFSFSFLYSAVVAVVLIQALMGLPLIAM